MVTWVRDNHPSNKLLGVGLSMGANVMTKFLGENVKNQKNFLGAISICQGYNLEKVYTPYNHLKNTMTMIYAVPSITPQFLSQLLIKNP